jgi:AcrR family transcriptional regulator
MSAMTAATTRERILDIALDLFIRKGYAETSLREIAGELGLSKAALYYHFESKQDILLALHLRVHDLTTDVLPALRADADTSAVWERLVDILIGIAVQNRRLIELHIRNQEAIAELHGDAAGAKHGAVMSEVQDDFLGLARDPSVSAEVRIRRFASLGTVAAVLLGVGAFEDLSDAELEAALRNVTRDVLGTVSRGAGAEA